MSQFHLYIFDAFICSGSEGCIPASNGKGNSHVPARTATKFPWDNGTMKVVQASLMPKLKMLYKYNYYYYHYLITKILCNQ